MKKILLLAPLALSLFSCGGGGSGSGGNSTTSFPVGSCIINAYYDTGVTYANPTIYGSKTLLSGIAYQYTGINDTYLQLVYSENESGTNGVFSASGTGLTKPLGNACAQSPISQSGGTTTVYNGDVMYFTNCSAKITGALMTFTSDYGIYLPSQYPGNGTPLQAGNINFTCTLH